jgi:general secretion pathway protein G
MRTRLKWANTGRRSGGFTLIEIMVVVIILGILAATIIPQFVGTTQDAKVTKAKSEIATLESLLEVYALHMDGRYPGTDEGLKGLVSPPSDGAKGWKGPYLKELRPDPWGNSYQYRFPGLHGNRTFDLWSRGADGADGGEGPNADVTNWQERQDK